MEAILKTGGFKIRTAMRRQHGFRYKTHLVSGYLNGERIRRQFASRDLALGELNRLEVQAANTGEVRSVVTRLSTAQVAEAEAAFARLAGRPLPLAVEHFIATYRPPTVETPLQLAGAAFLKDRVGNVSAPVEVDYGKMLKVLYRTFPGRLVHSITTEELKALMKTLGKAAKSQNNTRTYWHAFFEFCVNDTRRWCAVNPVKAIRKHDIARGTPHTLSASTVREMFAFLETYRGGPRSKHPEGFLCGYFALATFAGIRPSVDYGEIRKIHDHVAKAKIIDLNLGVIRIEPEIAKTNDLRTTKIQPNLRAWLEKYPTEKFPLIVPGMADHVAVIRKKFGIKNDTLRHTFVTAHVAKFKSLGGTALEAGNSESVIKKFYMDSMAEAKAEEFWSVLPTSRS